MSSAYAGLIDCPQINFAERLWMTVCVEEQSLAVIYESTFAPLVPLAMIEVIWSFT